MNPIGAALDVLVLVLLVWALGLGLKLNGRLKALREGQDGFAKAVTELDVASRRAEAGLAEMRRAAEETHDSLLGRIETARGLVARLEAVSVEAASVTRAPSVTGFARDSSPSRGERSRALSSPVQGEVARPKAETEGARVRTSSSTHVGPAPAGFADLIRRTLREPR